MCRVFCRDVRGYRDSSGSFSTTMTQFVITPCSISETLISELRIYALIELLRKSSLSLSAFDCTPERRCLHNVYWALPPVESSCLSNAIEIPVSRISALLGRDKSPCRPLSSIFLVFLLPSRCGSARGALHLIWRFLLGECPHFHRRSC